MPRRVDVGGQQMGWAAGWLVLVMEAESWLDDADADREVDESDDDGEGVDGELGCKVG